jgi:hypothetical protein
MSPTHARNLLHASIASHVPGRLRVRLAEPRRAGSLVDRLMEQQGIDGVSMNRANNSLTVRYDQRRHSQNDMLDLLSDLDVVFGSAVRMAASDEPEGAAEPLEFLDAIERLSARLATVTGLPFNLKLLLPLSFAAAGLWSIGKRGLRVEQMPGWLLLWFAFDMFVKLHPRRQ